jgi:hypothetical protein
LWWLVIVAVHVAVAAALHRRRLVSAVTSRAERWLWLTCWPLIALQSLLRYLTADRSSRRRGDLKRAIIIWSLWGAEIVTAALPLLLKGYDYMTTATTQDDAQISAAMMLVLVLFMLAAWVVPIGLVLVAWAYGTLIVALRR